MNIGKILAKLGRSETIVPVGQQLSFTPPIQGAFYGGKFRKNLDIDVDYRVVCGYGYWDGKRITVGDIVYDNYCHNFYITYEDVWRNSLFDLQTELQFSDEYACYYLGLAPILTYSRITYENTKHNQSHNINKLAQHITNSNKT